MIESMETVKDAIKKAAQTLGLSQEEFAPVPEHESVKLYQKLRQRFCTSPEAYWWLGRFGQRGVDAGFAIDDLCDRIADRLDEAVD